MQNTMMIKNSEIKRCWYKIDATNIVLGKLAVVGANILRGKDKKFFTPNVDCGDYLIITNSDKIKLSGNKLNNKFWYNHSGYIGGLRKRSGKIMIEKYSDELVRIAIKGMLPKNKLANKMINKLFVCKNETNKYDCHQPKTIVVGEKE